jgi:hypothetical protein
MVIGVVNVAHEEPEIEGEGQNDEETEDDFFEIHVSGAPFGSMERCSRSVLHPATNVAILRN